MVYYAVVLQGQCQQKQQQGRVTKPCSKETRSQSADAGQRRLESEANESRVVIWLQRKHPVSTCAYFRTESQQSLWGHFWNNQDLLF